MCRPNKANSFYHSLVAAAAPDAGATVISPDGDAVRGSETNTERV